MQSLPNHTLRDSVIEEPIKTPPENVFTSIDDSIKKQANQITESMQKYFADRQLQFQHLLQSKKLMGNIKNEKSLQAFLN